MANQYNFTPMPTKEALEKLYKSGFTQSELGNHYKVTQKVIWTWFKRLGIKSRVPKNLKQWGKNNKMWKGGNASYAAIHHWVEKQLGKPNICENCGTKETKYRGAFEWANIGHAYRRDLSEWIRLCRLCHRKMDKQKASVLRNYLRELEGSDLP